MGLLEDRRAREHARRLARTWAAHAGGESGLPTLLTPARQRGSAQPIILAGQKAADPIDGGGIVGETITLTSVVTAAGWIETWDSIVYRSARGFLGGTAPPIQTYRGYYNAYASIRLVESAPADPDNPQTVAVADLEVRAQSGSSREVVDVCPFASAWRGSLAIDDQPAGAALRLYVDPKGATAIVTCTFHLVEPVPGRLPPPAIDCDKPITWQKLDEASGTTAWDESGNDRDGVYVNGPTPVTFGGRPGREFNGTSQYVQMPETNYWRWPGGSSAGDFSLTVGAFVRLDNAAADNQAFTVMSALNVASFGTTRNWWFGLSTTAAGVLRVGLQFSSYTSLRTWTAGEGLMSKGTVHHVAFRVRPDAVGSSASMTVDLFLDGVAVLSPPAETSVWDWGGQGTNLIGRSETSTSGFGRYFHGALADVFSVNCALEDGEIDNIAQNGFAL